MAPNHELLPLKGTTRTPGSPPGVLLLNPNFVALPLCLTFGKLFSVVVHSRISSGKPFRLFTLGFCIQLLNRFVRDDVFVCVLFQGGPYPTSFLGP